MTVLLVGGLSTSAADVQSLTSFRKYLEQTLQGHTALHSTYLDKLFFDISPDRFSVTTTDSSHTLDDQYVVFIRGPKMRLRSTLAYYLSGFCTQAHIACPNSYSQYYPGTKLAQAMIFRKLGAPFLRTLYTVDKQLLVEVAAQRLGFPFILKTNVGSHGDSNYLIYSLASARKHIVSEPDVDFIAQEYCPNDCDYRLLLIGNEKLVFERRGGPETHLNNTSKGATAALVPETLLPKESVRFAHRISQALGLGIMGLDVIINRDNGNWFFLEANSQPQLRVGAFLEQKQELLGAYLRSLTKLQ